MLPKIVTPKYETVIPSTGKLIEFRPYLVKEEKILMIALDTEDEKQMMSAMGDVISECCFSKIDLNSLTTYDVEYLFLQIRAKSVGESVEIPLKCEKCQKHNQVKLNLSAVEIQYAEENREHTKTVMITDKIGLNLRHILFKDICEFLEARKSSKSNQIDAMIVAAIDSVFDDQKTYKLNEASSEEISEFINSMSSSQLKEIQSFIETLPSVICKAKFKCVHCDHMNELALSGVQNFFE